MDLVTIRPESHTPSHVGWEAGKYQPQNFCVKRWKSSDPSGLVRRSASWWTVEIQLVDISPFLKKVMKCQYFWFMCLVWRLMRGSLEMITVTVLSSLTVQCKVALEVSTMTSWWAASAMTQSRWIFSLVAAYRASISVSVELRHISTWSLLPQVIGTPD